MFRTKLQALQHPTPDSIDTSDYTQFANTVLWIEDQKIRLYKIEDRAGLRAIGDNKDWETQWNSSYEQYKQEVGMPALETNEEQLSWLLSYAVRLEYFDNADEYKIFNSSKIQEIKNNSTNPTVTSANPFDKMNMQSNDFENGVRTMAKKLQIADHTDFLKMLEASSRLLYQKFRPQAKDDDVPVGTLYSPAKDSGKSLCKENILNEGAKALRLLQIQNIRDLQTTINETIVAVQELTADPRTDTKLGKVGF